ncbi:MAG: lysophospholipid acyltransferase family protein [Nitrospirales bacterium]
MNLGQWAKLNLVPPLGARLIQGLGRTLHITKLGEASVQELYQKGQSIIFAFWHGRQLMMPLVYQGKRAYILISQHRDGELIHRIIARFGFHSVRGSTTRGGNSALRQLIRYGRQGADLVVTPDGPKGPRASVQEGVVYLAKMTGLPIVPVTCAYSKKNSSPVGISLSCHIQVLTRYLYGELQCGLTRPPLERFLK